MTAHAHESSFHSNGFHGHVQIRPRPLQVKRDPHFVTYVDSVWNLIEEEGRLAAKRERGVLREPG